MKEDAFQNDRLSNILEYFLETNPSADIFNIIEFIRNSAENLNEELYLTKFVLNSNKMLLNNLQYYLTFEQDKKKEYIENLKGMYYNPNVLDKYMYDHRIGLQNPYLSQKQKELNIEKHELDLLYAFFNQLYKSNIDFLKTVIDNIELEIESAKFQVRSKDQQEATPETAKQPDKIVLKRGRPKVKEYEMKIIAFDTLETALKTRIEKNYSIRSLSNYDTLLRYCKKYFHKNLSELTIEDIEQEKTKLKKKSKSSNNNK